MSKSEICTTNTQAQQTASTRAVHIRPAVDLIENEQEFQLFVEMPGVDHSCVDVSIERNELKVHGTADFTGPENSRCVAGIPGPRVYERTFHLTDDIDRDQMSAEVHQGVLTLRLPKSNRAKRITLNVKGS